MRRNGQFQSRSPVLSNASVAAAESLRRSAVYAECQTPHPATQPARRFREVLEPLRPNRNPPVVESDELSRCSMP